MSSVDSPLRTAEDAPRPEATEPVDVSLIDEMLRLCPLERLRQNDRMLKTVAKLRSAFAHQGDDRRGSSDERGS